MTSIFHTEKVKKSNQGVILLFYRHHYQDTVCWLENFITSCKGSLCKRPDEDERMHDPILFLDLKKYEWKKLTFSSQVEVIVIASFAKKNSVSFYY